MKETRISIPELVLVAGTRGMLGVGVGLLVAGKLGRDRRVAAGWTLLAIGVLTTIPLAFEVLRHRRMAN